MACKIVTCKVTRLDILTELINRVRAVVLSGNVEEAKNLVRRVFKLNGSFKADFLDDPAFDSVWDSF